MFVSQRRSVTVDGVIKGTLPVVMQLLLLTPHQIPVKLLAEEEVGEVEAEVGVGVGAGGCHLAARVQVPQRTGPRTPLMTTMSTSRPLQGSLAASLLL